VHILPEQAGNWSYPQSTMSEETIAFTMCTGLAGRLYQAGLLDRMTPQQLALVATGVQTHKDTRNLLAHSTVRFPTGLPSWDDDWITVAFCSSQDSYLIAWRQEHAAPEVTLELPHLEGVDVEVTQIYPPVDALAEWTAAPARTGLTLTAHQGTAAARMLRLTPR
jgi:alpha-galactosidase